MKKLMAIFLVMFGVSVFAHANDNGDTMTNGDDKKMEKMDEGKDKKSEDMSKSD